MRFNSLSCKKVTFCNIFNECKQDMAIFCIIQGEQSSTSSIGLIIFYCLHNFLRRTFMSGFITIPLLLLGAQFFVAVSVYFTSRIVNNTGIFFESLPCLFRSFYHTMVNDDASIPTFSNSSLKNV